MTMKDSRNGWQKSITKAVSSQLFKKEKRSRMDFRKAEKGWVEKSPLPFFAKKPWTMKYFISALCFWRLSKRIEQYPTSRLLNSSGPYSFSHNNKPSSAVYALVFFYYLIHSLIHREINIHSSWNWFVSTSEQSEKNLFFLKTASNVCKSLRYTWRNSEKKFQLHNCFTIFTKINSWTFSVYNLKA